MIRFPAVCMLIFVGLSIVSDATTFFEFTAALSSISERVLAVFSDGLTHNVLEGWPTVLASASQLLSFPCLWVFGVFSFLERKLLCCPP